jgi:hypothetical protein
MPKVVGFWSSFLPTRLGLQLFATAVVFVLSEPLLSSANSDAVASAVCLQYALHRSKHSRLAQNNLFCCLSHRLNLTNNKVIVSRLRLFFWALSTLVRVNWTICRARDCCGWVVVLVTRPVFLVGEAIETWLLTCRWSSKNNDDNNGNKKLTVCYTVSVGEYKWFNSESICSSLLHSPIISY